MTLHRKIGGIHWFSIGRLRISVCMKRSNRTQTLAAGTYNAVVSDVTSTIDSRGNQQLNVKLRPTVSDLKNMTDNELMQMDSRGLLTDSHDLIEPKLPRINAWTWPEGVAHVMNREDV